MNAINTINPLHSLGDAISLFESLRTLNESGNRIVRSGIRNNLVTFPPEVPVFKKTTRPDLQAKIAVLYFIRGWSTAKIGERYGIGRQRVAQILTKWRIRAVHQGYVQLINESTPVPIAFLHEMHDESAIDAKQRLTLSKAAGPLTTDHRRRVAFTAAQAWARIASSMSSLMNL